MPNLGDCPGETLYERGRSAVAEHQAGTRQQAWNGMLAQLNGNIKTAAEADQTRSYQAALALGDGACKPGVPPCDPCDATPVALP